MRKFQKKILAWDVEHEVAEEIGGDGKTSSCISLCRFGGIGDERCD